jgi:hypothetical protein
VVTRNWISESGCDHEVVQVAEGTDFGDRKRLNGEEDADDENDECVYVIREKTRSLDEHHTGGKEHILTLLLSLRQKCTERRLLAIKRWQLLCACQSCLNKRRFIPLRIVCVEIRRCLTSQ